MSIYRLSILSQRCYPTTIITIQFIDSLSNFNLFFVVDAFLIENLSIWTTMNIYKDIWISFLQYLLQTDRVGLINGFLPWINFILDWKMIEVELSRKITIQINIVSISSFSVVTVKYCLSLIVSSIKHFESNILNCVISLF